MMKVGIDAWGLSGDLLNTGMGQHTYLLLRQLPEVAPDLSLVAYGAPREERPGWLPDSVQWRTPGRRMPLKLTGLESRLIGLPVAVGKDRLDIFYAPAVHARPFFPPLPALRCPLAVTLHDLIPMTYYDISTLPRRQQIFYKFNLRRALGAKLLITVSEHARQEIAAYLGRAADRVTVIHNGIHFERNNDLGPLQSLGIKPPYLLYAGSYEPRKNLVGALRAYQQLVAQGLPHRLVAIVERASGHAPALLAHLAKLGLGERVLLVHSLSEEKLRALYTHAAVLVFPSLAEGFGYPPLQAAACGVPVVATDLPVLREVMASAALYTETRDESLLAANIGRVLMNSSLRRQLVADGYDRAANFSMRRCAERHATALRAAAGSTQSARSSLVNEICP